MNEPNIMEAISEITRAKGLSQDVVLNAVQEAIALATKRKYRNYKDVEARINAQLGTLEVFHYKTVTETCEDPENEIALVSARALDPSAEIGDEIEYEIEGDEIRDIIAQTARQMVFQKIREAERDMIMEKFKGRIGEVLHGEVSRIERGRVYVSLQQTEAVLQRKEQIHGERFANGDYVRVVLLDVQSEMREASQLVISRTHPDLLIKLFELEVPEIYDGTIDVVGAVREPGKRAKIAVRSNDPDVDPVGACVGMRGSRVQAVVNELRGEKIDIVEYNEDLSTYLANAMAPAELSWVKIEESTKTIDVKVDSDQLSLAIGRQGQNVRLASQLLEYTVNVSSTTDQSLSLEEQIREQLQSSRELQDDGEVTQPEEPITTVEVEGAEPKQPEEPTTKVEVPTQI